MAEREGAVKGVKIVNGKACLYCHGCARYLGTADATSAVRLKCPVCKHESAYRVNVAGFLR